MMNNNLLDVTATLETMAGAASYVSLAKLGKNLPEIRNWKWGLSETPSKKSLGKISRKS